MLRRTVISALSGLVMGGVIVSTVLASPFGVVYAGVASGMAPATTAIGARASTPDEKSPDSTGGPREAIRVHGQWAIEVREPDGTIVSQTEFQNDLTSLGAAALSSVLARNASVGRWEVGLVGQDEQICGTPESGGGRPCVLLEVDEPSDGEPPVFFKTLTREAPSGGADANKFVLRGSATAGRNGVITRVGTNVTLCTSQTAPAALCDATAPIGTPPFTEHFPSPGIAVSAGQQIQVTIKISFSS